MKETMKFFYRRDQPSLKLTPPLKLQRTRTAGAEGDKPTLKLRLAKEKEITQRA